jgi:hypothetical protein
VTQYNDVAVVITAFTIKQKGIIEKNFPAYQYYKIDREEIFNVGAWIIGKRSNLEIHQKQEEEKYNNLDVSKKDGFL